MLTISAKWVRHTNGFCGETERVLHHYLVPNKPSSKPFDTNASNDDALHESE